MPIVSAVATRIDAMPAHACCRRCPMMLNLDPTGTARKLYRGRADPASVISDNERMSIVPSSALMTCSGGPLSAIDADLLIVPWFQGELASAIPDLDAATGGELDRALVSNEFSAKPFELFFATLSGWRARRLVLIGGGGGERGTDLV